VLQTPRDQELVARGSVLEAPLHRIGLIARDSPRVEPCASPLKVLPIDDSQK
jgi:hypothetical protein